MVGKSVTGIKTRYARTRLVQFIVDLLYSTVANLTSEFEHKEDDCAYTARSGAFELVSLYGALKWRASNRFNPLMLKVAKTVTQTNGVRRHTGLTHGF